jgi:hypothetical protein
MRALRVSRSGDLTPCFLSAIGAPAGVPDSIQSSIVPVALEGDPGRHPSRTPRMKPARKGVSSAGGAVKLGIVGGGAAPRIERQPAKYPCLKASLGMSSRRMILTPAIYKPEAKQQLLRRRKFYDKAAETRQSRVTLTHRNLPRPPCGVIFKALIRYAIEMAVRFAASWSRVKESNLRLQQTKLMLCR